MLLIFPASKPNLITFFIMIMLFKHVLRLQCKQHTVQGDQTLKLNLCTTILTVHNTHTCIHNFNMKVNTIANMINCTVVCLHRGCQLHCIVCLEHLNLQYLHFLEVEEVSLLWTCSPDFLYKLL